MFDAYALVQAQEQLKLGDDSTRSSSRGSRRCRSPPPRPGGAHAHRPDLRAPVGRRRQDRRGAVTGRLKALQDLDARTAAEVKKAYEAIDQVLDSASRRRFRVFEEQMERRKLELVTRARQNNRANNRANAGRRGQP